MKDKPITLSIETSIGVGSISVLEGYREVGFRLCSGRTSNVSEIYFKIRDLLIDLTIDKQSIELIAVSSGFGSFTGQRIGLALAKGLSKSLKCPYVEVSPLEALCYSTDRLGKISTYLQKGKGDIYYQNFEKSNNGSLKKNSETKRIRFKNLKNSIEKELGTFICNKELLNKINEIYGEVFAKQFIENKKNLSALIGKRGAIISASDNDFNNIIKR